MNNKVPQVPQVQQVPQVPQVQQVPQVPQVQENKKTLWLIIVMKWVLLCQVSIHLQRNQIPSINYNFSFLGDASADTRINTPKEFSGNENSAKSKSQSDFEKLIEARNSEQFAKGIQRV